MPPPPLGEVAGRRSRPDGGGSLASPTPGGGGRTAKPTGRRGAHLPPPHLGEVGPDGKADRTEGAAATNRSDKRPPHRAATPHPLASGSGTPPNNGGRKKSPDGEAGRTEGALASPTPGGGGRTAKPTGRRGLLQPTAPTNDHRTAPQPPTPSPPARVLPPTMRGERRARTAKPTGRRGLLPPLRATTPHPLASGSGTPPNNGGRKRETPSAEVGRGFRQGGPVTLRRRACAGGCRSSVGWHPSTARPTRRA